MEDLISRQAAIDEAYEIVIDGQKFEVVQVETLMGLPPAQPEIIRCKDCKYWEQNAQHGYDEDNEEYHNYCLKLVPDDDYYAYTREADDYCSRGERKRGER